MPKKSNKIVSRTQIPFKYRASRPKIVQWLARWFLRVFGWKVEGLVPPVAGNQNLVLIAGPHTSNWDGVFGFAAILGLDAKITFFGKYTLFNKPVLGRFLKYMGGIPVDKSKPGRGLTDVAIENMKKLNGSLIAMSPEGTRAKTETLCCLVAEVECDQSARLTR
jgi:1-acyl-sn-glycerol-3-phosphate acyltransferase